MEGNEEIEGKDRDGTVNGTKVEPAVVVEGTFRKRCCGCCTSGGDSGADVSLVDDCVLGLDASDAD